MGAEIPSRIDRKGVSMDAPAGCTLHQRYNYLKEGATEAAPEAGRQAVGGGCQSGWGRLLSVTKANDAGTCRQWDRGWA